MADLEGLIGAAPFFSGFSDEHVARMAACGRIKRYESGAWLIRQNAPADRFMILLEGHVMLKAFIPQLGMVPLETLGPSDPLGWSWLVRPRKWHYDARALEDTEVIAFDADCLQAAMENDHELGYRLQGRMIQIIAHRLQAARLQGLDMYGNPGRSE